MVIVFATQGNVMTPEGKPLDTDLIALLGFPSAEAVMTFATYRECVPCAAARRYFSESWFQLIEDADLT